MVKLKELIELNPQEKLKKGTIAKKIALENIDPFTRDISSYSYEKYKGGSKFRNGDTLLVRITPSLENGKTAFVNILDKNEIAFGSTEYYVLRPKLNKIDPYYLYYLTVSDNFRREAINSMTGTSGRQRVQKEAVLSYELTLPKLNEQHKIAHKLKILDDKIKLNIQINENLVA